MGQFCTRSKEDDRNIEGQRCDQDGPVVFGGDAFQRRTPIDTIYQQEELERRRSARRHEAKTNKNHNRNCLSQSLRNDMSCSFEEDRKEKETFDDEKKIDDSDFHTVIENMD